MNHAIPSTAAQNAVPPSGQPTAGYRDEPQSATEQSSAERNPAQMDDSPDAILGYN